MGLYRNEQGGFACLALLKIVYLFIGINDHIVGTTSTEGEQHRQRQKKHDQCNAQYDAFYDMAIRMCFGLMQAKIERNEHI